MSISSPLLYFRARNDAIAQGGSGRDEVPTETAFQPFNLHNGNPPFYSLPDNQILSWTTQLSARIKLL